ncbi:DUF1704 domain-containing protein [Patescibacteria group bacterium]|nr:DUF1704 domain-containing protein [Patescibacteria group bacterium]
MTRQCLVVPHDQFIAQRRLKKREAVGLVVHELAHVVRAVSGRRQALKLLGSGLASYQRGEEGVATFLEQQVTGARGHARMLRHLAASYSLGVLDARPRPFGEVFVFVRELLQSRYRKEQDEELLDHEVWRICVRLFRGCSPHSASIVLTSPIIYREGNACVWDLASRNDREMRRLLSGKYDPGNAVHQRAMDELGIYTGPQIDLDNLLVGL